MAEISRASSNESSISEVQIRQVKIAILGAPGVGKTSLVQQFVFNQWDPDYRSTKEKHFYYPSVIINNHLYELKLIDIPPIPFFPPDTLSEWRFCRGYGLRTASAYILVFDVSRAETFHYIRKLRDEITESRDTRDIPIFVAGNKHDLAAFSRSAKERSRWHCQETVEMRVPGGFGKIQLPGCLALQGDDESHRLHRLRRQQTHRGSSHAKRTQKKWKVRHSLTPSSLGRD